MPYATNVNLTLPSDHQSPGEARRRVQKMCRGMSEAMAGTAQLLVSELVTNAVVHGEGPIGLRMSRDQGTLRVEVSDTGARAAHLVPHPDPEAESGRGLFLLAALATTWGTLPPNRHGAKTLWFELT